MEVWGVPLSPRKGVRLLRSMRSPSAFMRLTTVSVLSALVSPIVALIASRVIETVTRELDRIQKATWQSYLDLSKEILERETRRTNLALIYGVQFREDYRGSTPE